MRVKLCSGVDRQDLFEGRLPRHDRTCMAQRRGPPTVRLASASLVPTPRDLPAANFALV